MLRFFRHIRKTLMEQNKVRTYVLYAIGEILLVVIGILLALQVNNWNLDRQDQLKEQQILQALKVEFEANLFDLQRVINEHRVVYQELQEIHQITVARQYDNMALDSLVHGIFKWFTFTDRPGASTNLINSGNLNLITNNELRDLITQWSGIVEDVVDEETYVADFTRETMIPFLSRMYPMTNQENQNNKYFIKNNFSLGMNIDPVIPNKEVDWQKILNNQEFQSQIAVRKMYELHSIMLGRNAEDTCLRILELINQEIEGSDS